MYYESINKERLMLHKQLVKKLNWKRQQKAEIIGTLGLKSLDFSKTKVTSGTKKLSEEERTVIRLEKINNQIRELEAIVIPEQKEIETQLSRIEQKDWRYKEILQGYYIDDIPAKEIIVDIFGIDANKNPEAWKSYYRLQKTAIRELQKVSDKPFIEIDKQLVIEV